MKVRISWNSWPLFSRWLQSCDVCLRLGSRVCVCFVLLCCLFVGWQQHRSYHVIDAMVYPKNWRLEDELSTGKTFKSLDWVWYSYIWLRWCAFFNIVCHEDHHAWSHVSFTLVYAWKNSWIWSLRHFLHELDKMIFWMMFHHLFSSGRLMYSFWLLLVTDVIWTWKYFLQSQGADTLLLDWISVQCSNVSGWDVMSKGGMEIDHPMGEGD